MQRKTWRRAMLMAFVIMGTVLAFGASHTLAHAVPERAVPPIDGSVETAPAVLEIVFSQEVADGTTVEVFGPDGRPAHASPAEVDLNDPDRKRVTIQLFGNLPAGTYTVNWVSVSAEDGDTDSGSYTFTVTEGGTSVASASPAASPAASPEASPEAAAGVVPAKERVNQIGEEAQQQATDQAAQEDNIEERDLGLAVLPGIGAAMLIYLFWRAVRPKRTGPSA